MLFLIAPSPRKDETDFRSDHDGKMASPSLVRTVLARRYKILETVDLDSFKAHDLALDQTVTVRRVSWHPDTPVKLGARKSSNSLYSGIPTF
jgi:hypothetical protein